MSLARTEYDSAARPHRAIEEIVEVSRSGSLLRELVSRNVKVRYKRSLIGVLWTAANPLLMLLVLTLVFTSTFRQVAPAYPVFLLPGLLMWNLFAQATTVIAVETSSAAALWKRVRVSKTVIPLSTAITNVVNLLLVLLPFAIVLVFARWPVGISWLALIPVLVFATAFAFGVGLLLASVALYFPDAVHLYQMLLSALFFVTPVIYPTESAPGRLRLLLDVNPLSHFVEAFRSPIYRNLAPSLTELGTLAAFAFAALTIGWYLYTRCADDIPHQS